jgi:hypothetical protein
MAAPGCRRARAGCRKAGIAHPFCDADYAIGGQGRWHGGTSAWQGAFRDQPRGQAALPAPEIGALRPGVVQEKFAGSGSKHIAHPADGARPRRRIHAGKGPPALPLHRKVP